jgi:hypothetical protein
MDRPPHSIAGGKPQLTLPLLPPSMIHHGRLGGPMLGIKAALVDRCMACNRPIPVVCVEWCSICEGLPGLKPFQRIIDDLVGERVGIDLDVDHRYMFDVVHRPLFVGGIAPQPFECLLLRPACDIRFDAGVAGSDEDLRVHLAHGVLEQRVHAIRVLVVHQYETLALDAPPVESGDPLSYIEEVDGHAQLVGEVDDRYISQTDVDQARYETDSLVLMLRYRYQQHFHRTPRCLDLRGVVDSYDTRFGQRSHVDRG